MEHTAAMACPHCGSWAVKADRSLGGRMVCGRCGAALGIRTGAGQAGPWPWLRRGIGRPWRGWLGLALLVGVSALLANQPPAPQAPAGGGENVVPIR